MLVPRVAAALALASACLVHAKQMKMPVYQYDEQSGAPAGTMMEDEAIPMPPAQLEGVIVNLPSAPENVERPEPAQEEGQGGTPAAPTEVSAQTLAVAPSEVQAGEVKRENVVPPPKPAGSASDAGFSFFPPIVFAIPTMRRWKRDATPAPEQYLTPLIDGIVADMSADHKRHVKFLLYNADKEPEKHAEVHQLASRYGELVKVINKPASHHSNDMGKDDVVQLEKSDGRVHEMSVGFFNWIAGETKDATNLLFEARKLAPYVVFLEDDVKPTRGMMSKLFDYLHQMDQRNIQTWFMIDLYTPRIDWGRNPLYVKNFERYDYECCTQAMLFRSDRLLDLLMYEASHPNLPIDDNIRDYSREMPDQREVYAIVPNLFEHVGRYSSNPEKSQERVEHQSINWVP